MSSDSGPQTGLNAAVERRSLLITNQKAAKTAMLTGVLNIAAGDTASGLGGKSTGSFESRHGQRRPSALNAVTSSPRHAGPYLRVGGSHYLAHACYTPAVRIEEAPASRYQPSV